MTTMVFLAASNFSVGVLPLFFSRTTMVPVLSLLETTCNCGLFITTILAAARPGFFLINSGSSPACLALCIKKKPSPARATITKITSAAKTPTIHRMTFAPEDLGGAGGIPPGICGLMDGVDIAFSSFEGGYFLRGDSTTVQHYTVSSAGGHLLFCLNSEFPQDHLRVRAGLFRLRGHQATPPLFSRRLRCFGQRLAPVKAYRILNHRDAKDQQHPGDSQRPADIEDTVSASRQMRHGPPEQCDIAQAQEQAQFGGSHFEIGNFEITQCVAGKIDFNRKHQIRNQEPQSDPGRHISGQRQAAEQEQRTEGVHHVVNIKSVAWTAAVAVARQGAIQAVTQPVDRQAGDNDEQSEAIATRPPICNPGAEHGRQADKRKMIRVDPGRSSGCQPEKSSFFQSRQKALLRTFGFTKMKCVLL